jgi:DNA-binding LacI/PurR family transcriptional regulator
LLTFSEHYSTRDRLRGYVKAMNEARLEPHIYEPQVNPISDSQALVGQIASWLKGDNPPTAVVAYEDYFALPVLAATVHLGWRIPRDLSLIGIHDSVIGEPGFCISTMCLPAVEMGRVGVEMLHRKIEHPDEYLPARTLPLRWEPGLTCAPPSVRKVATR